MKTDAPSLTPVGEYYKYAFSTEKIPWEPTECQNREKENRLRIFLFFLVISGQQDPDRSFIEKKGLLNLSIYPLVRFELVVTKH